MEYKGVLGAYKVILDLITLHVDSLRFFNNYAKVILNT